MDRQLKLSDRVLVVESGRCGIIDAVDTSFGVAVLRVRYDYRPEPCQWFAAHELRLAARDWSIANVGSWLASRMPPGRPCEGGALGLAALPGICPASGCVSPSMLRFPCFTQWPSATGGSTRTSETIPPKDVTFRRKSIDHGRRWGAGFPPPPARDTMPRSFAQATLTTALLPRPSSWFMKMIAQTQMNRSRRRRSGPARVSPVFVRVRTAGTDCPDEAQARLILSPLAAFCKAEPSL